MSLMDILASSSYNAVKYLGDSDLVSMKISDRLQIGMAVNITIIDPITVKDNATYTNGTLPITGILFVVVNGVIVVEIAAFLRTSIRYKRYAFRWSKHRD